MLVEKTFEELETSMSRNRNTAKNFLLLFLFYCCTSTLILRFNECWSINT